MYVSFPLISNVLDITWVSDSAVVTLPAGALPKYCNEHVSVCVSVCLSVCLSVCPRAYLRNHTDDLYQFFCACCLWQWLSPPPAGWRNLKGNGQILVPAIQNFKTHKHWQSSLQPSLPRSLQKGLFSRRQRHAAEGIIQYTRQAQLWAYAMLPNGREGVMGVHSAGEVWYLRLPCWCGSRVCIWVQTVEHAITLPPYWRPLTLS